MNSFGQKWQASIEELASKHRVPGVSLAIYHKNEQVELTAGLANVATGAEVSPGTLFLTASVTKIFTATCVMRLVENGTLGLDVPVKTYIPELLLTDKEAESSITLRHLLSHTSGIEGDNFIDYGRGDDHIAKLVAAYSEIPQLFPPGRFHSYCNAGFSWLARVVEKVTGSTWDSALRTELLEPLGLTGETTTLLEEAILKQIAIGHYAGEEPTPVRKWEIRRSQVPSGGVISSARNVLALARLHLSRGRASDGTQLISPELIKEMQRPHAKEPSQGNDFPARGLAWEIDEIDGERVLRHGGNTEGNTASLSVIPGRDFAFVLLTNSGSGTELVGPLFAEVVSDVLGLAIGSTSQEGPPSLTEEAPALNLEAYVGEWEALAGRVTIERSEDEGLLWTFATKGDMEGLASDMGPLPLRPVTEDLFLAVIELPQGGPILFPIHFYDLKTNGGPEFMGVSGRIVRRTA